MSGGKYRVRAEDPGDEARVREVVERAFGQGAEADIVDELRRACPECLSLVAVGEDGEVIGHVLFSPVEVRPGPDRARSPRVQDAGVPQPVLAGVGLGPLAVLPERQRQGVGTALVEHGIALLRARPCPFVIVLGHPDYYTRFGFEPASLRGLRSQWEGVPDEAFMVLVLDEAAKGGVAGVARYRPEFDAAM